MLVPTTGIISHGEDNMGNIRLSDDRINATPSDKEFNLKS